MVWGCFAASGPEQLAVIDEDLGLPVAKTFWPSVLLQRTQVIQQDKKYTTKSTCEWLKKQKMILEMASQSPDFNPVEMTLKDCS